MAAPPLRWHLKARTAFLAAPGGFFLRAEAMHAYLSRIDADPSEQRAWGGRSMHARSHGESFLEVLRQEGSQVILATHSPLLAALPGANVIEIGEWGMRPAAWDELELTRSWKGFLEAPERWLKHLLG